MYTISDCSFICFGCPRDCYACSMDGGASLGVGNKGPDLKLSVGRTAGKWTYTLCKRWGSTDFSEGWKFKSSKDQSMT